MTTNTFAINETYLAQTTRDLVRINSINPLLTPDGKGETEIGAYVAEKLNRLGLEVSTTEIAPGRVNVVGVLKGSGGGRSLLLNAHLDTVGVDGMTVDPFGGEIGEGKLYGRGAQDMKASLAAMLAEAGMETVLLGPKGYGLHSAEEWVELKSVVDLAYILTETAIKYCGLEK